MLGILEIQGHRLVVMLRSRPLRRSPIELLVFHRPKLLGCHIQSYDVCEGAKKPFPSLYRFFAVEFELKSLMEINKVYYNLLLPLPMSNDL
jgi:hypothetical protein